MTVRFLVSGVVQGVGFRWFVLRRARVFGITGYARNLADGRVEIHAAGSSTALQSLERELWAGPEGALVRNVEKAEILDEVEQYKIFDIR